MRRTSDNAILTTSTAGEISFATAANTVYVVERTAKPLSSYTSTTLTGTAEQRREVPCAAPLHAGHRSAPATPGLVNNTALTYDAELAPTSGRGYGDYNDDTHHSPPSARPPQYTFTGTGVEYCQNATATWATSTSTSTTPCRPM